MTERRTLSLGPWESALVGALIGSLAAAAINLGRIASALERAYPKPAEVGK